MGRILDAFWRACGYCVHPRVIVWSLLPLAAAGGLTAVLGYAYWESSVAAVRDALERWELVAAFLRWLESIGATQLRSLVAPLIVVALAVPVIVVATLLLVAWLATPAIVRLVAARRFPQLERRGGTAWWQGFAWSLACTLTALLALALSVPLWLVPPLVTLIPPLVWGWLTCRVLAFDVLSAHATPAERRLLMRQRGWSLLAMGIVCGYLGALPSLLWAAGAAALIFAPLLVLVAVWLYTLVFAFAAAWFAHYLLQLLNEQRSAEGSAMPVLPASSGPT
jgi:Etoposide-induced protein 2.4 (EI24)